MKYLSLFVFFFIAINTSRAEISDSIGVEQKGKQAFILHKVAAKETLYALKRKYDADIEDIKKYNPALKEGGLKIGMVIKIPTSKLASIAPSAAKYGRHLVEKGETLFSISRKYDVHVREIKRWNKLKSNNISIGQVLVVSKNPASEKTHPKDTDTGEKEAMEKNTKTNPNGIEMIVESGLGELIDANNQSQKYLAMHKSAPYGAILKVTNELTGFHVYVRVIGTIPDIPTNENVIIKVSNAAYKKLGAVEKYFRATTEYTP